MTVSINNASQDEVTPDINMTPLIDIMLVLLIIFMMTSSIAVESGIDIGLPQTTSENSPRGESAVVISLDAAGIIAVQGKTTAFEKLQEAISTAIRETKSPMVILEGDRSVNLGKLIQIMDTAGAAGARKFSIAAERQAP
ncbi:MAG: biopolymer transporter ExbD [Pseudomonadota bacterium]